MFHKIVNMQFAAVEMEILFTMTLNQVKLRILLKESTSHKLFRVIGTLRKMEIIS